MSLKASGRTGQGRYLSIRQPLDLCWICPFKLVHHVEPSCEAHLSTWQPSVEANEQADTRSLRPLLQEPKLWRRVLGFCPRVDLTTSGAVPPAAAQRSR